MHIYPSGGIIDDGTNELKGTFGPFASGPSSEGSSTNWAGVYHSFQLSLGFDDYEPIVPYQYSLEQNYPNPFNPSTTIEYSLKKRSDVTIIVYNILGQEVNSLISQNQAAGSHSVTWDGDNESGKEVASGIYFYRIRAGEFDQVRKMILLK